eukprot:gene13394-3657_t
MNKKFNDILPSSIEMINMTGNNAMIPSNMFGIDGGKYKNFSSLIINDIEICGMYPDYWLNP